ncbi:MAG: tetratricopeptide repeat protein [Spirochaeta sp.]
MSLPQHPALEHIIFISIPEEWSRTIEDFQIDPRILLPVETPPDEENWSIQDLSWEAIISAMLKILAYNPEHDDARYYRDFIQAIKPDLHNELGETGIIKARNRDLPLAEEIFRALIGLQPDNPLPKMNLALIFEQRAQAFANIGKQELRQEYLDAAYALYHELFSMDELPTTAHLNAGFFFAKQNDFDRALYHLHAFITEGTDDDLIDQAAKLAQSIETQNLQDNRFKEAYDLIAGGQESQGIAIIRTFLEQNPEVWNGWFLLGWGLRKQALYHEAAAAFEKSAELNAEQADTYNELAICYMELERFAEARESLEKAFAIDPQNTKILSNLGILSIKTDRIAEACGFFRTVLEYDPEDPLAQQYIDHLGCAEL